MEIAANHSVLEAPFNFINLMDVFVWPDLIGSDFASVVHELVNAWNLFQYFPSSRWNLLEST